MQHQWILDVLHDLRSFATRNGLDDLSRQIDLTMAAALEPQRGLLRSYLGKAYADSHLATEHFRGFI